ncbi:MAG: hypothetical protein WAT58_10620 [Candidatus Dormiibacterota bacterium]
MALGVAPSASAGAPAGSQYRSLWGKHVYPLVSQVKHTSGAISIPLLGAGVGPMTYGGGPIQRSPKVFVVFWGWHGNDPAGVANYLKSFLGGVGGSGWANIQTQYSGTGQGFITNPGGQLAGTWNDDTSGPGVVTTDGEIAAEGVKAAQHFGYSADADYFVATPTGTGTAGFKTSYCAYHGAVASGMGPVAFTYLPYIPDAGANCGKNFVNGGSAGLLDGVSIVGGHEYAEAVTDPQPSSGWTDLTGQETGDKCAWINSGTGASQNINLGTGRFAVQTLYSNAAGLLGGCVISYP